MSENTVWRCRVCGYAHTGATPPASCPVCKVPADKFNEVKEDERTWAAEHVVGVANGVDPEIIEYMETHKLYGYRKK